jgi:excisionase family DNA binding protein
MKSIPFCERFFCSINEACEAIGFGRSKLYDLIKNGRIRTIRIDGRTKIVVASLLELGGDGAGDAARPRVSESIERDSGASA